MAIVLLEITKNEFRAKFHINITNHVFLSSSLRAHSAQPAYDLRIIKMMVD